MDPFTISTSIFGLLKATAKVAQCLAPYISAAKDTPKIVAQVHSEVVHSRTIVLALEGLTQNLASIPVKRAALIQIEQLITVFTDGVLLFSELEASLPSPPSTKSTSPHLPIQSRLLWAKKETAFTALFTRLQGFKMSILLMLTILQSDSDINVAEHQQQLSENVTALLQSNQSLSWRLMNLENAIEMRPIVSKPQSLALSTEHINNSTPKPLQLKNSIDDDAIKNSHNMTQLPNPSESIVVSNFDFENVLEASRVYQKAQRDTMDFSFRSSIAYANAWSIFSGYSLSDVSIISMIALPLYPEEILNSQHYIFEEPQAMPAPAPSPNSPRVKSFYQECLEVELRLSQIHGLSELFAALKDSEEEDPGEFLVRVFRRGVPLLIILKTLSRVGNSIDVTRFGNDTDPRKIPKKAVYKFVECCLNDLGFRPEELFSLSELYENNIIGLTKVIKAVARVLDTLTISNDIEPVDLTIILSEEDRRLKNPSSRDIIVKGFLLEERSHVVNLERLLKLKWKIGSYGSSRKDILNGIFTSLDSIVDMHRYLLLGMEMTARKPLEKQSWAMHFEAWSRLSSAYVSFINSKKGVWEYTRIVVAEQELIKNDDLISAEQQRFDNDCLIFALLDFPRLLYLPLEHLPKYLGFLQKLQQQSEISDSQLNDASVSIQALQSASQVINTAIKDNELCEAQVNLIFRVQDWKSLGFSQFGKLLLFDVADVVIRSRLLPKYHIYLFDKIILFFTEHPSARKPAQSLIIQAKDEKANLQTNLKLRGGIYIAHISKVLAISVLGSYACQIFWKDKHDVEKTTIRLATQSKTMVWHQQIEQANKLNA